MFKVQLDLTGARAGRDRQPHFPAPARGLDTMLRLPVATPVDGQSGSYEMRPCDFEALKRFHERTVTTVGTARLRDTYRQQTTALGSSVSNLYFTSPRYIYPDFTTNTNLSLQNPFLLHAYIAFTLMHDSHLLPPSALGPSHRTSLAFHWYHATVLFKQLLSRPPSALQPTERDSLWAASILLGAAAFAHLDSFDPYHAWPLKEDDSTDLDWLRMSEGKKAVWSIVDPTRPDSAFNCIVNDAKNWILPSPDLPIPAGGLPEPFSSLLELEPPSPSTNPYYGHASLLAQLLPMQPDENNFISFITFVSQPDLRYRRLLEVKDHRALLLLAWWYATVVVAGQWWVRRRAVVDGTALCIYLERHSDDPRIHKLLDFPRVAFRLAGQDLDVVKQRLDEQERRVKLVFV